MSPVKITPAELKIFLRGTKTQVTAVIREVMDGTPCMVSIAQFSRSWVEQKVDQRVYAYFGQASITFDEAFFAEHQGAPVSLNIISKIRSAAMQIKQDSDAAADMRELAPPPDEAPCRLYLTTPERDEATGATECHLFC